MLATDTAFAWTRAVPPAWQADLARLNTGENVSALHLVWQAGWPWRPVQRYEIYEVLPTSHIERILREEELLCRRDTMTQRLWEALRGPDPRTVGTWLRDSSVPQHLGGQRWRSASLVSHTQWRLHQQVGGFPQRAWIIEGEHGGHAWQLGQFEQAFLLSSGLDPATVHELVAAWPDPGDRSYAEYDAQVFTALAERDQLHRWRQTLRWDDRVERGTALDLIDAEGKTRHREMMQRLYHWIDHQVGSVVNDIPRSRLPGWSAFTRVEGKQEDQDTIVETLLED